MEKLKKLVQASVDWLRSQAMRVLTVAAIVLLGVRNGYAQVTNTPTAVLSTISSNSATAFDTFISIFVATLAIGFVIYFARRGASAKH